MKKHPLDAIVSKKNSGDSSDLAYVTWEHDNEKSHISAVKQYGTFYEEEEGLVHKTHQAEATRYRDFSDLAPGMSARPGMTRSAYDVYREDEANPTKYPAIIQRCNSIYHGVGLIRNIIDLMGDFASQGIRVVHPNKRIEKFGNNWFKKVQGQQVSERFCNLLYRTGNVVIRERTATITVPMSEKLYKTHAKPDIKSKDLVDISSTGKREIPWRFTFLDASTVSLIGGPVAAYAGKSLYAIQLPQQVRRGILNPAGAKEREIITQLPREMIEAAKSNKPYPLDADKTHVYYYKKDDWAPWAMPMLFAIFKDIVNLEKLKLADNAALDGAISNIRIFKIGNLEYKLLPTRAMSNKLANILQAHVGGGTIDIVWGPDIELVESKSEVYKFLGEEKYSPTLNAIYAGVGIPPTLTGTYGAAGTTNNFISLKTLTKRLTYGRNQLTNFWEMELAKLQHAMGFRFPFKIEYDLMDLGNEDSVKALYRDLADRNIISDELVRRIFDVDPDMEDIRINRESKRRKAKKMPPKHGPFSEGDATESKKKMFIQQGMVTPSEVGVDLDEKDDKQELMIEKRHEMEMELEKEASKNRPAPMGQNKPKGQPGQGRPKNATDKTKRKTKTFTPRSRAALAVWATSAQSSISKELGPAILHQYGKKNMRQLTDAEVSAVEKIKFGVLFNMKPLGAVTQIPIAEALKRGAAPAEAENRFNECITELRDAGFSPNLDNQRDIRSQIYADLHIQEGVDE